MGDYMYIIKMPRMFSIIKFCQEKECQRQIEYKQLKTGGNDPSISNKMRYSQYVQHTKPRQTQTNS